jgi:hypothetical protein
MRDWDGEVWCELLQRGEVLEPWGRRRWWARRSGRNGAGRWDLERMDGRWHFGRADPWQAGLVQSGAREFRRANSLRLCVPAHGKEGKFRGAPAE